MMNNYWMLYFIGLFFTIVLFSGSAFAQESLSELAERLDRENLEKVEKIQTGQPVQQFNVEEANCLPWQTERAVSGGGIECIGTGVEIPGDQELGIIIVGGILFLIIIIIAAAAKRKSGSETSEPRTRRSWTEIEKEKVRIRQNGKCQKCHRPPPRWEYHHKDGDRSNNDLSNCQGLCPNCHSVKTHE